MSASERLLHYCPKCGRGLSQLVLVYGYANAHGLRVTLRCKGCGGRHMIVGDTVENRRIVATTRWNLRKYNGWRG